MIPRMRTAPEIVSELKNLDPCTAMTVSGVRRLAKEGKLHSVKVGNRILINLDQVLDYLNNPSPEMITTNTVKEKDTPISADRIENFKRTVGM